MQVKELLESLWIPESEVTTEKRRDGTEIRYKNHMLDVLDGSIDIYKIDSEWLEIPIWEVFLNWIDIFPVLKRILQLN